MRVARTLAAAAVIALVAACSSDQQDPTAVRAPKDVAPLHNAAPGKAIPGSYVVVLKPGASVRGLTSTEGVAPRFIWEKALNGFSAQLTEAQVAKLQRNPNVEFIQQDQVVTLATTQTGATWGLDRIDQRDRPLDGNYTYTPTGAGVRVYIVDTGVRTTHTLFGGRASIGRDFIGDGSTDCNGHGTHVAGTVGSSTYGVAKGATIIGVRVFGCGSTGSTTTIINGINWVAANAVKPAVANMSLGGGADAATDAAVTGLINAGVIAVVAAGNENQNACNTSPARVAAAITVGSTTSTDVRSSFSNYGSCVDVFAPGSGITSTWYTSNTATQVLDGTSMASPHVAGVAALYLQNNPTATQAQVAAAITGSASSGKLTSIGTGSPNLLLYSPLTTTPGGGGGAPCTGCTLYTGSLTATGQSSFQPGGTYYQSLVSGTHRGWLRGPTSGADFDLYLQKWNGSAWVDVASGTSATASEDVTYSGTSGYYRWEVYSYSGTGSYNLWITQP